MVISKVSLVRNMAVFNCYKLQISVMILTPLGVHSSIQNWDVNTRSRWFMSSSLSLTIWECLTCSMGPIL
jgi:hypothetical protein